MSASYSRAEVRRKLEVAFAEVPIPDPHAIVADALRDRDGPRAMVAAFAHRHWSSLANDELVRHRASLWASSAVGYRAYLPAYLAAALGDDQGEVTDVAGYAVHGLVTWPNSSDDQIAAVGRRTALLHEAQHEAIATVLRYLIDVWGMRDAWDILCEWMKPTAITLRSEIERAFADVGTAEPTDMVPTFQSVDAEEMAWAFLGKPWTEIPLYDLYVHRHSLGALTPTAFRAYVPAYLSAGLTEDRNRGPGLRGEVLACLKVWPHQTVLPAELTHARLSALDRAHRVVIAKVLRFYELRWYEKDATEVLREWTVSVGEMVQNPPVNDAKANGAG